MRQKNTVFSPEYHNQFQNTQEQIVKSKEEKTERNLKDKKEGQSDFWVKKETKKY
jgi:hypothetical protein